MYKSIARINYIYVKFVLGKNCSLTISLTPNYNHAIFEISNYNAFAEL